MKRPRSILMFERLFLASILLGFVIVPSGWETARAELRAAPELPGAVELASMGMPFMIGIFVVTTIINVLLWYFIARRASVVAKWILIAFNVLAIVALVTQAALGLVPGDLVVAIDLLVLALNVAAIWYLFRPDARLWFAGEWKGDGSAASG